MGIHQQATAQGRQSDNCYTPCKLCLQGYNNASNINIDTIFPAEEIT